MDLVDRLFERLRIALDRDPAVARAPSPTVGDVYQRLIPYRAVRGELGILELAEYEHALLRLLAGERGHMVIEGDVAREELRRELASPNPILGVYRDYSGLRVRLLDRRPNGGAAADHCARCGTELRDEWRFCTRCGTPRAGAVRHP
jgi:hypothetical protein